MRELWEWIKSLIDANESPSFGRAGAAFVVYFIVLWASYIVSKTSAIPSIPESWLALVALLWGTTSIKEAFIKSKELTNATTTGGNADTQQVVGK